MACGCYVTAVYRKIVIDYRCSPCVIIAAAIVTDIPSSLPDMAYLLADEGANMQQCFWARCVEPKLSCARRRTQKPSSQRHLEGAGENMEGGGNGKNRLWLHSNF